MALSASPYPRPYIPETAPVIVVPEGTTSTSPASGSWSSVASLVPLASASESRVTRLPKAPVFIRAPPAFVRLDDDGSDVSASDAAPTPVSAQLRDAILARSRTYDFDDDFPSIAASDSTTSPNLDKERDRAIDFDLRRSLARKTSVNTSGTSSRYRCRRPSSPTTETTIVEPPALTREKLQLLAEEPRSPRRYDFSDDFASIAGSEAPSRPPDRDRTPVANELLRCQSEQGEFLPVPPRSSLASSIKNRLSQAARDERGRLSFRGRGQKRSGIRPGVEDSILHDWNQASAIKEESEDGDAGATPGCASFFSMMFTAKEGEDTKEENARWDLVDDNRFDDVQFVSILAYEEFMHSPTRPSTVTKLLSRLRGN